MVPIPKILIVLTDELAGSPLEKALNAQGFETAISNQPLDYFLSLENVAAYTGVVTVEKGYRFEDVLTVMESMRLDDSKVYLAYPGKKTFGKRALNLLFWFIHSKFLHDVQTGLRGYPAQVVPRLERNGHALDALIEVVRKKIPVEEVQIPSGATSDGRSNGKDLIVLLRTFIKYVMSSFSSFLVDITLFQLVIFLMRHYDSDTRIVTATIVSRVCSSIVNFLINKNLVFGNKEGNWVPALKYFSLVLAEMFASGFFVAVLYRLIRIPETIIKLFVDFVLFFTGYLIEKVFIFDR